MESYRKLGKVQFIAGPKGFTLCRHNEYGIINMKKKVMIKCTRLYDELMLLLDARRLTEKYYILKEKGMFSWPVYQEHRKSIQKSFAVLRHALGKYKDRRVKAGFFNMRPHQGLHLVHVMSPLYTMPRKEALKKIRRRLRIREAFATRTSNNVSRGSNMVKTTGNIRAVQLVLLCISVICNTSRKSNLATLRNIRADRIVHLLYLYAVVIIVFCMIVFV